jgi:hypothetical protein
MNNMANTKRKLSKELTAELLETLSSRFNKHMDRHQGILWQDVEAKLLASTDQLWSLHQMEVTGGEPDVVAWDKKIGTVTFFDCSPESPAQRRSLCYDQQALDSRKENKPKGSAMGMASEMGVSILSEEQYRYLQTLGKFDLKTSSWVATPAAIRQLGGAVFCDRRYDTVFFYHNGAESYYAARAFRASLTL